MIKDGFEKGSIVIYKTPQNEVELKVKLEKETIWLTQNQIALLFGTQRPAITKHLNNIFKTREFKKSSVSSILEHTALDGKTYKTQFYNLDAIISVGYRVNSKQATQFRIWSNKILRQFIIKGYAVNEKRLLESQSKFKELQNAVLFLQKQSKKELLKGQETEILNILADYSKTLSLLEKYDIGKLDEKKGGKTKFILKYSDCVRIISELKSELICKKEASDLFGQERGGSFEQANQGFAKGQIPKNSNSNSLTLTAKVHIL